MNARSPSVWWTWPCSTWRPRSRASRCTATCPSATATGSPTSPSSSTRRAATTPRQDPRRPAGRDARLPRPGLRRRQDEDRRRRPAEDLRRIEAVIDVLDGDGSRLAVDVNGRFDLATALAYGRAIEPYGLFWYEEIGDPLDYHLNATVAEHYSGPIATGENLFSLQDTRNLIRYGGLRPDRDTLQVDPALAYGLVEYLRIQDMLRRHGWSSRRCVPHGGHQFSLHIAAALKLGGNESYPGEFQPTGGFADDAVVEKSRVGLTDTRASASSARPRSSRCCATCTADLPPSADLPRRHGRRRRHRRRPRPRSRPRSRRRPRSGRGACVPVRRPLRPGDQPRFTPGRRPREPLDVLTPGPGDHLGLADTGKPRARSPGRSGTPLATALTAPAALARELAGRDHSPSWHARPGCPCRSPRHRRRTTRAPTDPTARTAAPREPDEQQPATVGVQEIRITPHLHHGPHRARTPRPAPRTRRTSRRERSTRRRCRCRHPHRPTPATPATSSANRHNSAQARPAHPPSNPRGPPRPPCPSPSPHSAVDSFCGSAVSMRTCRSRVRSKE
ncbi:enolase C-terminal domain-like protein [Streptomyces sp. M19]